MATLPFYVRPGAYPGMGLIRDDRPARMISPITDEPAAPMIDPDAPYFPAIAQMYGGEVRPPLTVEGPMEGPPSPRTLPPIDNTYFPSIAEMVGGGGAPPPVTHQPHPGMSPDSYGPGPTVPIAPSGPAPTPEWTPPPMSAEGRALRDRFHREAFGEPQAPVATGVPQAYAPASRRFSSTRPEFIYTNPASAQQAARNYEARLGFESAQDQGYRDYLSRLQLSQDQQKTAQALQQGQWENLSREGAANRQSNERISVMSGLLRQYQLDDQAWQQNESNRRLGEGYADTLNKDPSAKVNRNYVKLDPQTGKWVTAFPLLPRPQPPTFSTPPGQPVTMTPPPPMMVQPQQPQAAPPPPVSTPTPAPPASDGLHWYSFLNPFMRREMLPPRELPAPVR